MAAISMKFDPISVKRMCHIEVSVVALFTNLFQPYCHGMPSPQICFLRNGDLHSQITCLKRNHGFHLTLQSTGQFQTNARKRQRTQRRPPSLTRLPLAGERGWFNTSSPKGSFQHYPNKLPVCAGLAADGHTWSDQPASTYSPKMP